MIFFLLIVVPVVVFLCLSTYGWRVRCIGGLFIIAWFVVPQLSATLLGTITINAVSQPSWSFDVVALRIDLTSTGWEILGLALLFAYIAGGFILLRTVTLRAAAWLGPGPPKNRLHRNADGKPAS